MKPQNAALLNNLPANTTRVLVKDEMGRSKYKPPSEILDTDEICVKIDGTAVTMSNNPGRKKTPSLRPVTPKVADLIRAKELFIEEDDLLDVVSKTPEKEEVLNYVIRGLAEEAASLGFERIEAEREGQPTSQISMRRVNALKAVGDSWLKRKEQVVNEGIDIDGMPFKKVFGHIMETFKEALQESGVRPEVVDIVFTHFSKKIDDPHWTNQAQKKMREEK